MKRWMLLLTLGLMVSSVQAQTYRVGAGEQYAHINTLPTKLFDGDVIEIVGGTYTQAKQWPVAGKPDNPVIVKCVGPGECIFDGKNFLFEGTPRAVHQISSGAYVFRGLTVKNAHNGNLNASGFRAVGGYMTLEDNIIFNNNMGVMSSITTKETILRNNRIFYNATGLFSHNLYLAGEKVIIENNDIGPSISGINVKTRAKYNEIRNNYIHHGRDGEIQCTEGGAMTLTPGSDCLVENNVIVTIARNSQNNCCRVIAFGHEGVAGSDRVGKLVFNNNRVTVSDPKQIYFSLDSVNAGLEGTGNVLMGGSLNLVRIRYGTHAGITGSNNNYQTGSSFKNIGAFDLSKVDSVPPAAPGLPTITQTKRTVELAWEPSGDTGDVAYYVIRKASTASPAYFFEFGSFTNSFENLMSSGGPYTGQAWTYTVFAVDAAGNRSVASPPLHMTRI